MNFVMKADFRTVKVKDQPIPSLLGWGRRIPGPLGAWVLNHCSLTGTWALPVGDLRQGSFKLGRSSGLQSCLGSSSSRMQVMDAGIWAAQAVGHSSGPGSYRAWANEVRSTGMGARAATGLAGSKDLRRRRHGFAESIQFSVSGSWPFASGDKREKGALVQTRVPEAAGSACLKEKLFCGAHGGSTWPPTASAVGRLVREEVLGKSPAQGGRPSGRLRFSGP